MEEQERNNENLNDPKSTQSPDRSNMPDNQVPRHRSNENSKINEVQSDAEFLSREVGEGDFGSEEARADPEKGNQGEAGNMPNTANKDAPE
ncbi:hypothetical protein [Pedobacter sp. R20-19]|uniref:hypothetical protein n=1 Tax=Pedobacter sp. R20-19 TaxID=1270196 RepID=UPI0004935840|nr:hypothetical protein [Pedobacter sp. R20-19]